MSKIDDLPTRLYHEWDRRWAGNNDKKKLTALGRLMFRAKAKCLRKLILELQGKNAIDVGCALGHTLEVLCETGMESIGIDVSENAIEACKRKGLPVALQNVEDVEKQFDIVFSDGMLEHFINFEPFVREFCRISNKFVVLIQPNHQSFIGRTAVYMADMIRGDEIVYEYNYRMKDFVSVFEIYNFALADSRPIFGDWFRLLVFRKQPPK